MAVTKPKSGETISTVSVTSMYDSIKTVVNTVPVGGIGDSAFGTQHLPSALCTLDGTTTTASDSGTLTSPLTLAVADCQVEAETVGDVTSDWAAVMTLNGLGSSTAGYVLPPCKVLVMFDATVSTLTKANVSDLGYGQAWFSVYYTADLGSGTVTVWDAENLGMALGYTNLVGSAGAIIDSEIQAPVSIWFVIDQTGITGATWTLETLNVKAGIGTGPQADSVKPASVIINNANLNFFAFYKDS